jgi:hypothetical protein
MQLEAEAQSRGKLDLHAAKRNPASNKRMDRRFRILCRGIWQVEKLIQFFSPIITATTQACELLVKVGELIQFCYMGEIGDHIAESLSCEDAGSNFHGILLSFLTFLFYQTVAMS